MPSIHHMTVAGAKPTTIHLPPDPMKNVLLVPGLPLSVALLALGLSSQAPADTTAAKEVPVVFAGGYETNPVDHGRPVALVAGALGVAPEVFREAFGHVHPAGPGNGPEPEQVRDNKAALM